MNIIYCGNAGKYAENVFEVHHMCQAENADLTDLNNRYDIVAQKTVLVEGGMVEAPFGTPHAVVIDSTNVETGAVVRVKAAAELLIDKQEEAVDLLHTTTEEKIKSICDSDNQKSLSMMYNTMTAENQARAEVYFGWHKNMLTVHYGLKTDVENAGDVAAVQAIIDGIDASFATLMSNAPLAEVDLSTYTV